MNRYARKLAVVLSLALIVGVGCGKDNKNKSASKTNAPTKADIKVGAIFDLSGATADVGTPFSEGIRDYVEYKNSQGGVEGHKVALTFQDYGYKVPQAEQLYSQYVSQGAKVFMGWGTGDTEALRPKVNADMIPFMSASYAETLADHKLNIGFKDYAMTAGATDFIAQIGQAKTQQAKYIIVQNVASPAAKLATNLASEKSTAQLMCLNWCADELFVKLAGPAAEKMIGVMPFAPPVEGTQGLDEINNFLKAKNTTAKDKGLHYVQGWYTMATMTQGIDNAIKANGDNPTGEQIKAGLEKISDFKTGVSDPISFSADYHAGLTSAPLYQVTGGAFKKISDPIKVTK